MNIVKINFENCYGIRKLEADFDFTQQSSYAIYSPNGTMKTSFSKAFLDLSKGEESKDLIFPDRSTIRDITISDGTALLPEQVFVVEPYNESFKSNKVSTLLVNQELKEKYDAIHNNITEKKDILIKLLKPLTGLNAKIDEIFAKDFASNPKQFYKALLRVKSEVLDKEPARFSDIVYKKVFSDKNIAFLNTKDFKEKLIDYINQYNELVDASTFFKKGVFNHNNASIIAKNLKDNGFFEADHSVYLNSGTEKVEVITEAGLVDVIEKEKALILDNPVLVKTFEELDSKLKANTELRSFRDYLLSNLKILPELSNLEEFKQKLWVSYLKELKEQYELLENEYSAGKEEIEGIIAEAHDEETEWRRVIDIFNKRFSVPFQLLVENQEDVILNSDAPNINFIFDERGATKGVSESELLRVLSTGEKRALYILNIIFEVEARKKSGQETLFIIDDIADSFDYKNKYAIIEYLKDISLHDGFYQIMLSHNFDFFRTVCSRIIGGTHRGHKLHTVTSEGKVELIKEKYQNNPFNHWKNNLETDRTMLIASIPFVRNLTEYTGDKDRFAKLTSLLHIKSDTLEIKIEHLEEIHKAVLKDKSTLNLPDKDKLVIDCIFEEADIISGANEERIDLEGKIVLAIAIRLKAEEYMISKIDDTAFVESIDSVQTYTLYMKYTELPHSNEENCKILEQVNLMTPENIHLNSFMYEPLLDMANISLIKLYNDTKSFA